MTQLDHARSVAVVGGAHSPVIPHLASSSLMKKGDLRFTASFLGIYCKVNVNT